jgi:hypothetical protein
MLKKVKESADHYLNESNNMRGDAERGLDDDKTQEEYRDDLTRLESRKGALAEKYGDIQKLDTRFSEAKKALEEDTNALKKTKASLHLLHRSHEERQLRWFQFNASIQKQVRGFFSHYLASQHFSGEADFHETTDKNGKAGGTLSLKVRTNQVSALFLFVRSFVTLLFNHYFPLLPSSYSFFLRSSPDFSSPYFNRSLRRTRRVLRAACPVVSVHSQLFPSSWPSAAPCRYVVQRHVTCICFFVLVFVFCCCFC